MVNLELSFPAKILWPNGRGHWATKHKATAKAKSEAFYALKATIPPCFEHNGDPIKWYVTFHPKTAHEIDIDNAAASLKAFQDGFALALQVNDKIFERPTINFGKPVKGGKVIVSFA